MKKLHDYGLGKLNRDDIEQINIELEAIHYRCSDIYFEDVGDSQGAIDLLNSVGHSLDKAVEALDGVLKLIRMRDAAHTADRFYLAKLRKKQRLRRRRMNGSSQAPPAAQAGAGLENAHRRVGAPKSAA